MIDYSKATDFIVSDADSFWIFVAAAVCVACALGLLAYLREVTVNGTTELLEMHEPNMHGIMASHLHFAPGEWPHTVPTTLGDGTAFIVERAVRNHDMLWVDYTQRTGLTLRVFNDLPHLPRL